VLLGTQRVAQSYPAHRNSEDRQILSAPSAVGDLYREPHDVVQDRASCAAERRLGHLEVRVADPSEVFPTARVKSERVLTHRWVAKAPYDVHEGAEEFAVRFKAVLYEA